MSSEEMSDSPREDDLLDLATLIGSQDDDTMIMPPPGATHCRPISNGYPHYIQGTAIDLSPLIPHATLDGPGSQSSPLGPLESSTRINVDIPKPHFPSKAQRRSSIPSSEATDSPSSTNASSGRSLQQGGLFTLNGLDATPTFNAPLSLEHQPSGAATIYGRPTHIRTVAVPMLNPMQPLGSAPQRSKSMFGGPPVPGQSPPTATPGAQRPSGVIQRSFSTPGVGRGNDPASNGTSSPLDDSPSRLSTGAQHNRHPSNSTSSLGPNVAGRIGVGGNVMVDPHGPSNAQKTGNAGAGAFVYKVYNMLLDPSFQNLISFNGNGHSFTVSNVTDFSKVVLPKHFKHNNFSSFVRQLNMYGFHKVNKTPRGQRGENNNGVWEFVHPKFLRGRPDLLDQIRRKPLEAEGPRKENGTPILPTLQIHQRMMGFGPDGPAFNLPPSQAPGPRMNGMALVPSSLGPPAPQFVMPPPCPQPPSEGVRAPPPPAAAGPATVNGGTPHPHPPPPPTFHPSHMMPSEAMPPAIVAGLPTPHLFGPLPPLQSLPPHSHSGPIDPIEALTSVQGEVLGRLHGVQDGYEALYRELYETRRRQDVLVELVSQMYNAFQTLAPNKVNFMFPSAELFYRSPDDNTPIFRITDHDPSHRVVHVDPRTQQPVSLSGSPSTSDFGFSSAQSPDRRVSIDPATYGAFGNLALHSNPASPAMLGPRDMNHSPFSPDFAESTSGQGYVGSNGTGGLHLTTHGLLAPGPSSVAPLSPGSALSTAVATPLPPSPSPFQQGKMGNSMVGLGMDLTLNGPGSSNGVNGVNSHSNAIVDPTLFMNNSPMANSYYDSELGGDRSGGSGSSGMGMLSNDEGTSPSLTPNGAGGMQSSMGGCKMSPGSSASDFKSEELDLAGFMTGPGSLSFQAGANGKGKKRPATGSMDLNTQPTR